MDTSSATSADRRAAVEGFRTPVVDLGSMTMEALVQEYINMKLEEYQLGRESEHLNQCVESLREDSVRLQQRIEVEEERAANQLIRRLADVELDARHREAKLRDEEAATRALLEKISTVSSQRDEMEAQLAKEQHYLLDQLQTQLMVAAKKKSDLEQRLVHEGKRYLNVLLEKLQQIPRLSEDDTQRSTGISSERTTPLLPACEEEHITTTTTSVDPTTSSTADASHATTTTTKTEADTTATTTAQPVGSPTTRSILRLEKKLNHLLRSHDRTMLQRQRNEEECSQLTERLRRIQQDTFLEVAKSAKLKEEIELARQRLLALDQDDVSWEDTSTTASCCATPHHQPTLSGSLIGVPTLRDHTKEVLSSTGAGFGLT